MGFTQKLQTFSDCRQLWVCVLYNLKFKKKSEPFYDLEIDWKEYTFQK